MQNKCEHHDQKSLATLGVKTIGAEVRPMLIFWYCKLTGRLAQCEGNLEKCEVVA